MKDIIVRDETILGKDIIVTCNSIWNTNGKDIVII